MCGIVAFFARSAEAPPPDVEAVVRSRDAMALRGPDGKGLWHDAERRVILGHRRLAILDTSDRGAQPMVDHEGPTAITFNGEIYNFQALRDELEGEGQAFQTRTDTEVLLALYRKHGIAFVDRLRGMYAFVLWDGRARTLMAARDPYGIKPLYVADDGRTLRIASQVKALVAGGGIDSSPEPAGHAGFFLWGSVPEPFTLFRGIRALQPGAVLVARAGEDVRTEARNSVRLLLSSSGRATEAVGPEALRLALLDTVKHHLVSDVPVGLFLSAGLDSRALAHLAHDAGADVEAVTLGFAEHEGTQRDEVPLAASLARELGLRHRVVRVTRKDFVDDLPRIFAAMDQPSIDGVNTWFVSKAAHGLKVALSGLGGDELFGGYPSFGSIPRAVRALGSASALPGLGAGARAIAAPFAARGGSPKWAGLLEYGGTWGGAYLLRRGLFMPWELPSVLDADLAREGWKALASLACLEESIVGLKTHRQRVSALESSWYMRNQLLRDADWAGMAHSLEIRVPLVDGELTRRLAPALESGSPPGKIEMSRAADADIAESVLARPKTGFVPPVQEWVAEEGKRFAEPAHRGWARRVYEEFAPSSVPVASS